MTTTQALAALTALSHEHRLRIFRRLIECGPEGLPAGVIGATLGLKPSSLTFHLQHLARSGLVVARRSSRQIFYAADFETIRSLVGFLTDNCCSAPGATRAIECKNLVRSTDNPSCCD